MRKIKFRAWDKKNKRWLNFFNISEDGRVVIPIGNLHFQYFRHTEVMQFTGLLDKNGKEIYEGDIVRVDPDNSDIKPHEANQGELTGSLITGVYYIKEFGGFFPFCLPVRIGRPKILREEFDRPILTKKTKSIEIIGNIYENPELQSK